MSCPRDYGNHRAKFDLAAMKGKGKGRKFGEPELKIDFIKRECKKDKGWRGRVRTEPKYIWQSPY